MEQISCLLLISMTNTTQKAGRILLSGCTTSVNFPLWVLVQDGLHVAPFNKHRLRYGILQQRSMDVTSWYEWFRLILIQRDNRLFNNKYVPEYVELDKDFISNSTPPELWSGNIRVREILDVMWDDFKSIKDTNEYVIGLLNSPEYWDKDLHCEGFRQVHICDYTHEVEAFIPPIFHVITVEEKPIDVKKIRQRISHSLEQ
ncbi:MAG: hypothetical protein HC815_05755 [Richelia sp. RM1_1_1]|nr:hypothetical protein [Richelia sp. RM1_1_1]